jgi:hypothetical protein
VVAVVNSLWTLSACDASALEYRKDRGRGRDGGGGVFTSSGEVSKELMEEVKLANLGVVVRVSPRGMETSIAMTERAAREMREMKDFILMEALDLFG